VHDFVWTERGTFKVGREAGVTGHAETGAAALEIAPELVAQGATSTIAAEAAPARRAVETISLTEAPPSPPTSAKVFPGTMRRIYSRLTGS
jgi:hypothetical protein